MDFEKAFATVLRTCRHDAGLTQEGLAFDADVDRSYISLLERGSNNATLKMVFRLCKALNVAPAEFVSQVHERMEQD